MMKATALRLEDVLSRINPIGEALSRLQGDAPDAVWEALGMVVSAVAELLPGSSVLALVYDRAAGDFDLDARVSAGAPMASEQLAHHVRLARRVIRVGKPVQTRRRSQASASPQAPSGPARGLPLTVSGEALGVILVTLPEEESFTQTQRALLDHMAYLAARAVGLARQSAVAQGEQARREKALRRLHRAGMLISSRSSLKDTLDAILKMALEITEASYGIFRLVDSSGANLIMRSFAGSVQAKPATEVLPLNDHSIMGHVALRREPVVISDLRQEPWKVIYYPFDYALEMRSELAVPLIGASGRLEGVLNLESPEVNAFDKEDRYILQILAAQAVVAIEGIRLVDALQNISAMLTTNSLQQIHQALAERACDLLNLPTSQIWMLEKDQLVIQAASNAGLCGWRLPLGGDAVSRCILSGAPVFEQTPANPLPASVVQHGAALIVPLFTGNDPHPVGAFAVYTAAGDARDFSQADWDKKVLSILGHYAALAVQNFAHLEALKFGEDQRATTDTFAAIGEIAANLLHRLNNKVGTIPVRVEGIQDKSSALLQAEPYLADNLAEIQRSASEAMQIVHESLDYLRPIQLRPVSVSASVHEALLSVRLPDTIQVECQGIEGLPAVQAGANRLALVFSNLFENAAEAMGRRGVIRLVGSVWGRWVEIRVSDSGPGIPTELHDRIFEFSYSSRSSAHPGNLGFGLWWVKSFMTRFGGKVEVDPGPDQPGLASGGQNGATFILSLPVAQEDP
ncbi:MAG TPA: GAF domain-containing protein [Anaerolineaceae bacterium]